MSLVPEEKQQSLELGVTSKQVHIKIIKKIIKSVGMSALCKHCILQFY